jgi:hypothetical protein
MKKRSQVFLGGSANPTTWRKDVAIPLLERHGITYFNPQVDEWHAGLVAIENDAKAGANTLLFVIDNVTRGIASIAEAAFFMGRRRKVFLVVQQFQESDFDCKGGTETAGGIRKTEMKDLNRGRAYIFDMAKTNNIPVHSSVKAAVLQICKHFAQPK